MKGRQKVGIVLQTFGEGSFPTKLTLLPALLPWTRGSECKYHSFRPNSCSIFLAATLKNTNLLKMKLNRLPGEAVVNWRQAKDFFTTATSDFQAATQDVKDTSSAAMQNAITSSIDNWLQAHPVVFRIFNIIIWAIDRPIISFVIIILTVAITFSIIKALNRLLEMAGLSLLQAPFRLIKTIFKFGWLGSLGIKQKFTNKNVSDLAFNQTDTTIAQNPQQRLAEISQRLQLLQKEHNELLQEAATILTLNKS